MNTPPVSLTRDAMALWETDGPAQVSAKRADDSRLWGGFGQVVGGIRWLADLSPLYASAAAHVMEFIQSRKYRR